jgi:MYXO-CTERM domain-containing protein
MRCCSALPLLWGALVVCVGTMGCAGEDTATAEGRPTGVSQPISGGVVDSNETAVFAMAVRRGTDNLSLCTATLIERNLFLTARHCLVETARVVVCDESQFKDPQAPLAIVLLNATELDEAALKSAPVFHGTALYLPSSHQVCGADIALVETQEQVPSSVAVPLAPRLTKAAQLGELYVAVGYGGTNDQGLGSGIRRSRQDLRVLCFGPQCSDSVAESEFLGQVGTCEGDSGGPALDSDGNVLGVLSRGGADCTTPIYGSTAAWAKLIADAARSAAQHGGYAPPSWTSGTFPTNPTMPTPSPSGAGGGSAMLAGSGGCAWVPSAPVSGLALSLMGLLALGAVRRRQSRPRARGDRS